MASELQHSHKGPSYSYVSLHNDDSAIRLIELAPGSRADSLKCSLTPAQLADDPVYEALSYVWGSSTKCADLYIGGDDNKHHHLAITKSLDSALRRLRYEDSPRTLWVDAVCIDQSNIPERNAQVRIMATIYGLASNVVVYLGEEESGSEAIPDFLDVVLHACRAYDLRVLSSDSSADGQEVVELVNEMVNVPESMYADIGLPSTSDEAWKKLEAVICRPWFRRVWVIQEVVFAPTFEFVCGGWCVPAGKFAHALEVCATHNLHTGVTSEMYKYGKPDLSMIGRAQIFLISGMRDEAEADFKKKRLIDILQGTRFCSATDKRNCVFAILSLSDEYAEPDLQPDYGKTWQEIYQRAANFFIKGGQGTELLACASMNGPRESLPSWVPDWSVWEETQDIQIGSEWPDRYGYTAAGDTEPMTRLGNDLGVLVVRAIAFDQIEKIGQACKLSDSDVSQIDFDLLECINELKHLLNSSSRQLPHPELEETVWRTMVRNQDWKSSREAPLEVKDAYVSFVQWCQHLRTTQRDSISGADPAWKARYDDFKNAVDVTGRWRRVVSGRGYAGQVPFYAEVGDIIAIIFGASEPYILRPKNGAFELIGKAYVHGAMNGEALRLGIDGRDIEIV